MMRQRDQGGAARHRGRVVMALALVVAWGAPCLADEPAVSGIEKPTVPGTDAAPVVMAPLATPPAAVVTPAAKPSMDAPTPQPPKAPATANAGAPAAQDVAASGPMVAQRGDLTLSAADVVSLLAHLDPTARQRLLAFPPQLAAFLRQTLRDRALLAQARAANWDRKPDVAYAAEQARLRIIIETYLASLTQPDPAYPPEADIQAVYDANRSRLGTPRQLHLAQIFAAVPPDAAKPVETAALAMITALRNLIDRQHKDFAAIARKESQDRASADAGGDLGWVRESQLQPGLREGVAGLADGALSPPLRGPNGWHLIRVIETKPAVTPPLAELHGQIAVALRQQKQKALAQAYLEQMDKSVPVRVDEIEAAKLAMP